MNGRSKSKKRKSKVKPPTEKKKDCKEVALQVAADVPPPAESPKSENSPVPMDSSASPARSIPSRGPQCFKCQRWGHVSYVCKHDTRCVKCALGHRASQCPKKAVDPCCCANCGQSHPASYRGCDAAPKTRRRRRKPQQQAPGEKKGVISKLANVLCKLMLTKDFFTEAQLDIISKELDDEKRKVTTSHASTQTDSWEQFSSKQGKAEEEPQPLPMETSSVPQAPPVKTNSTWSQTEPSRSNSVASQTPREKAPPTQHKTAPTSSTTPTLERFCHELYQQHPFYEYFDMKDPESRLMFKSLMLMETRDQLRFVKAHYPKMLKEVCTAFPMWAGLCKSHKI